MLYDCSETAAGLTLSAAAMTPFAGINEAVVTLKFKIKDDAPVGATTISANSVAVKLNSTEYGVALNDGTVMVKGEFNPALDFENQTFTYNGDVQVPVVKNLPEKFADYYDFSVAVSGCAETSPADRKYGFLSHRYLFILLFREFVLKR
jgi:hypothetical protein